MKTYYSRSTNGFYVHGIHAAMPDDVIEITQAQHQELILGQSNGKIISSDENGKPVLIDPPQPTTEQLATQARAKRDSLLSACDWTQVSDAPVDQEAWATYRQALRDITLQDGFPETINWPTPPNDVS